MGGEENRREYYMMQPVKGRKKPYWNGNAKKIIGLLLNVKINKDYTYKLGTPHMVCARPLLDTVGGVLGVWTLYPGVLNIEQRDFKLNRKLTVQINRKVERLSLKLGAYSRPLINAWGGMEGRSAGNWAESNPGMVRQILAKWSLMRLVAFWLACPST